MVLIAVMVCLVPVGVFRIIPFAAAAADTFTGKPKASASRPLAVPSFAQLPASFEANRGQAAAEFSFISRRAGYQLYFGADEVVFASGHGARQQGLSPPVLVRLQFVNTRRGGTLQGRERLRGTVNYLLGREPQNRQQHVPTYASIVRRSLYRGIDLTFYNRGQHLEYDFEIAPGARPQDIRLAFSGTQALSLTAQGDLLLATPQAQIIQKVPFAYQQLNGTVQPVAARYVLLDEKQVGIRLAHYDHSRPLVIDPLLDYGGFLGGSGNDSAAGIGLDGGGNIYVAGTTDSIDLSGPKGFQPGVAGGMDAFVTKIDPTGSAILYTTYLGGSGSDRLSAMAVDAAGRVHVAGRTDSGDFPTQAAAVGTCGSCASGIDDAFVARLDATGGALIFSTYLGGLDVDGAEGLALDGNGNVYVTGTSASSDFNPLTGAGGQVLAGGSDAFVSKLDAAGIVQYSRFFGGTSDDGGKAVTVDAAGDAYVTGHTQSTGLATANVVQAVPARNGDAFVASFGASGSLVYATYLGGINFDQGKGIAVDGSGNVYLAGLTQSTDFPVTANAFQPVQASSGQARDAFVAKLDPSAATLLYGSFLGGQGDDMAQALVVDGSGRMIVTGQTQATDFPVKDAMQSVLLGTADAFLAQFDPAAATAADSLVFATYLGGSGDDLGTGLALKSGTPDEYFIAGRIAHPDLSPAQARMDGTYVIGNQPGFPVLNQLIQPAAAPFQNLEAGMNEAFVAAVRDTSVSADLRVTRVDDVSSIVVNSPFSYTLAVANLAGAAANDIVLVDSYEDTPIPPRLQVTAMPSSGGTCTVSGAIVMCVFGSIVPGASETVRLTAVPALAGSYKRAAILVRASTIDPQLSNNRAVGTIKVVATEGGGGAFGLFSGLLLAGGLGWLAATRRRAFYQID